MSYQPVLGAPRPLCLPIKVNGNVIDPNADDMRGEDGQGVGNAEKSNYILVQTEDYLGKDEKDRLADAKVTIEELVSEKTYLCRFEPEDMQPIRNLNFVKWTAVYSPDLVTTPVVKGGDQADSNTIEVDVIFHQEHQQTAGELISAVADAAHVEKDLVTGRRDKARLKVDRKYLDELASVDAVQAIQPVIANTLYNNVARNIMMGRGDVEDVAYLSKNNMQLKGEGERVGVADTGVDDTHPAFTGRIAFQVGLARPGDSSDPEGHGTHVSGSVLGNGQYHKSASAVVDVQGSAPAAELVLQSIGDENGDLTGIPPFLEKLFQESYDNGARVHNNSWGATQRGLPYDDQASAIDKFVWENPDMVICFAAGNSGEDDDGNGVVDFKQIGSQAAAKNCITVGASESFRPESAIQYDRFTYRSPDPRAGQLRFRADPVRLDKVANDSAGMAAFSSRGPTFEGRIKPDIVAPGTCILSARSSLVDANPVWATSSDDLWTYNGGTSMACPLVSGACAILRQALKVDDVRLSRLNLGDPQRKKPSAALVKALLINGAVELKGQYLPSEAGPSPNFSSGWGRVNLSESVDMATWPVHRESTGCLDGPALLDGGSYVRKLLNDTSRRTLKITLVWSDAPGGELQNDLALRVRAGDNQIRVGNPTNRRVNNVEQIIWSNVPIGSVEIEVKVLRITKQNQAQPFALAWKLYDQDQFGV